MDQYQIKYLRDLFANPTSKDEIERLLSVKPYPAEQIVKIFKIPNDKLKDSNDQ